MNGGLTPETFVALAAAFGLGALHSFDPSHAKGVMVAYFIGQRRRVGDAVALGVIVTLAHTASVLALALLVRLLAIKFPAQSLEPPAEILGGVVVVGFGVWMLFRLRRHGELFRPQTHAHEHDSPYPHRPDEQAQTSLGQLFTVGLACGLVPCPAGLAWLPVSLSAGNLALSIWFVLAFSAGVGAVIVVLGILVCKAQALADRVFGSLDKHAREIQLAAALLVLALGGAFALRAVLELMGL